MLYVYVRCVMDVVFSVCIMMWGTVGSSAPAKLFIDCLQDVVVVVVGYPLP